MTGWAAIALPQADKAMENYVSRHHQDVLRKAEAGDAEAQAILGSFFFNIGFRNHMMIKRNNKKLQDFTDNKILRRVNVFEKMGAVDLLPFFLSPPF